MVQAWNGLPRRATLLYASRIRRRRASSSWARDRKGQTGLSLPGLGAGGRHRRMAQPNVRSEAMSNAMHFQDTAAEGGAMSAG